MTFDNNNNKSFIFFLVLLFSRSKNRFFTFAKNTDAKTKNKFQVQNTL